MAARYKVVLAYDGSAFHGMQRQKNGRSVQAEVEMVLRSLGWQGRSLLVAGRTDAGVHASGQVAAFDLNWRHAPEALQRALNASLPADVVVSQLSPVAEDFHPRYQARSRRYQYRLYCQPQRDPLRERYAWRVWPAPGLRLLSAAARQLRGRHDFGSFGSAPTPGGSTVRQVQAAAWQKMTGDEFVFSVSADGFLYRMVRRMVALQVKIGQGQEDPELVARLLEDGRSKARHMAPPQGLTLVAVEY
ncbi:MAG: tRNA pseudouridine(38-40) synthase TruA [Anaerolineales bacterium]|nr:tRNA pseudouridine(38-40) synthase TruA [Anaerolineales bacterium]